VKFLANRNLAMNGLDRSKTPSEHRTEAFVVHIWLERRDIAGVPPEWRGSIEHVTSRKRQHFRNPDAVVSFMAEYMHKWGVKPKAWALAGEKIRRFSPHNLLKRGLRGA